MNGGKATSAEFSVSSLRTEDHFIIFTKCRGRDPKNIPHTHGVAPASVGPSDLHVFFPMSFSRSHERTADDQNSFCA